MKFKIIILVILASVGFFNPFGMFSDQMQKLFFYLSMLGAWGLALFSGVSLRKAEYPRLAYVVVLLGIVVSAFMATAFHMQSLKVSLLTTLPYVLAYSFFFVLMKLDVPRDKIMNGYLVLCGISCLVYFANVFTMPNNMFGAPILGEDTTRGVLRIPVVFIEFFPMIVFYGINQWLLTKQKKWIFIVAVALLMIVLSVIRQIIALTLVLGLFFYFRNVSWKIKAGGAALLLAFVVYVLPMIPMYQAMLELSEQQKEENEDEENIRIQAWRFYTYENQTNALTPFLGNGMPSFGNSRWGIEFQTETDENHCLFADVGWAGYFWLFGGVSLLALITMTLKALRKRKPPQLQYLNYWLIFFCITSFASGPPIIYYQIIDIVMCFYLVYKVTPETETKEAIEETETTQPLRSYNSYPQLAQGKRL